LSSYSQPRLNKDQILELIKEQGRLASQFKGFEPRLEQQEMMANIIDAYNHNQISLIEAGTGTGKSLAYLLPAFLWAVHQQERTVISTNTIALQEQLMQKDIPAVAAALQLPIKSVLVKGMNNYLCLRKLEDALMVLPLFQEGNRLEIEKIDRWSQIAKEGSRSEMPFMPSSSTWEQVGAESEACSQNECPHYQKCFFYQARREAQDAQILIANHHLLFSDLLKRAETGNYHEACLLPSYKRIILDEAHHIEDVATEYFASRLTRLDFVRILSKLAADKMGNVQGKLPILKEKLQSIFRKTPPLELTSIMQRLTIDFPALRLKLSEQIHQTFDQFAQFIGLQLQNQPISEQKLRLLKEHQQHPNWKELIQPQAEKLIELLREYSQSLRSLEADLKCIDHERLHEQTKSVRFDIQALSNRLENAAHLLVNFLSELQVLSKVKWIEIHQLKSLINVQLVDAELDISKALVDFLFSRFPTVILCSATLTTNRQFDYMRERLGLVESRLPERLIKEHLYDSPFKYDKQVLMAVPIDMPAPASAHFEKAAFENVWRAIQASHGQAFVLFTSYTMLGQCAEFLKDRLKEHHFPLFKQGDDSRQSLLSQFKKTNRAVLFGTDTFWEGVDVAGDALRCVIIIKLPFKVPSEPIIQARTEAILKQGGNPFIDYAVPQAIVKFKQGFGRLIRQKWDRGCIICLDNRLITKGYGQLFLNSLPICEKAFMPAALLWPRMTEFYRQTYQYVINSKK
jgi:ATP-dependent DNA helicase DinG